MKKRFLLLFLFFVVTGMGLLNQFPAYAAKQLVIITSPFTTTQDNPSPTIIVEAQDEFGQRDITFNDTVELFTSSPGGRFSVDRVNWQDTDIITLVQGRKFFYYKDSQSCSPEGVTITVSRSDPSLTDAVQSETIQIPQVNAAASYITINSSLIRGDGITPCTVVITVNDTYGFPVSGRQVTIFTSRGSPADVITQPAVLTDINGQCTGTIVSDVPGDDTITAEVDGFIINRGVDLLNARGVWHFDRDLMDASSTGNNAVESGALWVPGRFGSALQFNGVSSCAFVENCTTINTQFSLEIWAKPLDYPATNNALIAGKYETLYVEIQDAFDGGMAAVDCQGGEASAFFGYDALPLNEWSHLVTTFQDGELKTYLNGTLMDNQAPSAPLGDSNYTMWFGHNYPPEDGLAGDFNGIVDEVKLYEKVLTEEEVSALYECTCRVRFTLTVKSLKFVTPAFSTTRDNPSPAIIVEAQDENQQRIITFNDTITLESSSGGRFSISSTEWQDTTIITLSQGRAIFYYKDSSAGNPVITISREGFNPDAQVETIEEPVPSDTLSYITVYPWWTRATGKDSITATVKLIDQFGYPISSKSVTLYTLRAETDAISANPRISDSEGNCTWTISSLSYGKDTVSAEVDSILIQNINFFDPFSEPDTFPHNWEIISGSWQITGGNLSGKGDGGVVFVPDSDWTDYTYSANLYSVNAGLNLALLFRAQDENNCYKFIVMGGQNLRLYRVEGGIDTLLNEKTMVPFGAGEWHNLKVNTAGSTITCYLDDQFQFSVSDSTYISGKIGLRSGIDAIFDNVRCYPVRKSFEFIPAALKLKILNTPKVLEAGTYSDSYPVEALYTLEGQDCRDTWCYDTISMVSSSPSGRFSVDKTNWSTTNESSITLVRGYSKFYYRDTGLGTWTITVYRAGLFSDTQDVVITEAYAWETNSSVIARQSYALADGISTCSITVIVRSKNNSPLEGKYATLYSVRGDSDILIQPALPTDQNGMCTGAVASIYPGGDTIYAICDGATITQNLVPNPSFEEEGLEGSEYVRFWLLDYYNRKLYHHRTNDRAHSGDWSLVSTLDYTVAETDYTHSMTQDSFPIFPNSVYRISAWIYNSLLTGEASIDIWDKPGEPQPYSTRGANRWEYVEGYWWDSDGYTEIPIRCVTDGFPGPSGLVWFDDMKVERMPMFSFVPIPKRLVITSPAHTITKNNPVLITIEARDDFGNIAPLCYDTVVLSSSSNSGSFSISSTNWNPTDFITLSGGLGRFYYKDGKPGNPVISVSREGLVPDSQTQTILEPVVDRYKSGLFTITPVVRADGTETAYIIVTVNDTMGYPMQSAPVLLTVQRGALTLITSANPLFSDLNGQCTFTAISYTAGNETFTARVGGETISYLLFDNFSSYVPGSNGSPVWSPDAGRWKIEDTDGNMVYTQEDSSTNYVSYAGNTGWKDYIFECRMKTIATKGTDSWLVGVIGFRSPRPDVYYYFLLHKNGWFELGEDDDIGGHHPGIAGASTGASPYDWHKYRVEVSGTSPAIIKIYMDDQLVINYSDDSFTSRITSGRICLRSLNAIVQYDDVKVYPCRVYFTPVATRLKITSAPFVTGINMPSPPITVEAQDSLGNKSTIFNEVINLSSSSGFGSFSIDESPWQETNVLKMSEGAGAIYYKDSKSGSPTITVSYPGLQSDTQVESITTAYVWETNSYLTVSNGYVTANGTEKCTVVVVVRNINYSPIPGKEVTVRTSRGDSDIIVQPGITDENGQCTATISSIYSGDAYVYACVDGLTITENLVPNPSFEGGIDIAPKEWIRDDPTNYARTSEKFHSGNYSLRLKSLWGKAITSDWIKVTANSTYKISAYMWNELGSGFNQYVDLNDVANDINLSSTWGNANWEYRETTWPSTSITQVKMRTVLGDAANPVGQCWFDDIKMFRIPTLTFVGIPERVKIVSSPQTISKNNPMMLKVEAQDTLGYKVITFNSYVILQTSSAGGTFSLSRDPWSGTDTIYLKDGEITFYYKDSIAGNPIVSVSSPGLTPDLQFETIVEAVFSANNSRLYATPNSAKASGTDNISVVVSINDIYGYPIANQQVYLHSTNENISVQSSPLVTNSQGVCTFTIFSSYVIDSASLSAVCSGETISYLLYDDFSSYAEGSDAGQNWTTTGGTWAVQGGEFYQSGGTGHACSGSPEWTDYTFEAKMKTPAPGTNSWDVGRLTFRYNDSSNFYFILLHTSGRLEYGVSRSSGWYSNRRIVDITGLDPRVWHNFKIVISGSGPVKIEVYVDGELRFTQIESEDTFVLKKGKISLWGSGNVTAFDDVKVYPCIVKFTAYRTGLITDAFKLKAGATSPRLTAAATGAIGGIDTSYNTEVIVSTSSESGYFSTTGSGSWTRKNLTLALTGGSAYVYYKDYKIGNPAITITPVSAPLLAGTQIETITACAFEIPYFSTRTSDTSPLILATARGYDNEIDTNFKETVVLATSSPAGRFSLSSTTWQETTIFRFNEGTLGFYYRDKRGGNPLITISQPQLGITSSRTIDILIPYLQFTIQGKNLRTGLSGTQVEIHQDDTIEYTVTVHNTGNETAIGIVISDTTVFDTSIYTPVAFISMDTSVADSWTYSTDPLCANWQEWGSSPSEGENVKGLKWLINTLGINEQKQIRFRVQVK